jgi:MFS family permease
MEKRMNLKSNRLKFIIHGFFLSSGIHVAEPSTILPLIVTYFSQSNILLGFFSSLIRGGAVIMQLYTAFFAQAYSRVMKPLRIIFFFRFISWFAIGISIFYFGQLNSSLSLWFIGIGLFAFSFCAGLGTIYFHELMGKIFTNDYRGVTWAYRQIFMGLGGVISGTFAAWLLNKYEEPRSFALVFMISSGFMVIGYLTLGTVKEFSKKRIQKKEDKFSAFLINAFNTLKYEKDLKLQIIVRLISYSYLFVLPFIVKYADIDINLGGLALGSAVPLLGGSMLGNMLWAKYASIGSNKKIISASFIMIIISLVMAIFADNIYLFILIFLLAGSASDGFKLAFNNLVLSIAPEEKRPVYFAIQNNLTSLGLFFSIPGGVFLNLIGYKPLIVITILVLAFGLFLGIRLKDIKDPLI